MIQITMRGFDLNGSYIYKEGTFEFRCKEKCSDEYLIDIYSTFDWSSNMLEREELNRCFRKHFLAWLEINYPSAANRIKSLKAFL